MATSATRPDWAGLAAGGGLLLPVELGAWPLRKGGVRLDGRSFQPKRELHLTLLTRAQARTLEAAGLDAEALARLAQGIDWRWRAGSEAWRLRRLRNGREAQSLIALVEQPGQAEFRRRIREAGGPDLGAAVPHLTLYTRGDPGGISVPDRETLAELGVERIDPALLVPP
jgi:hypothetical protein